MPFSYFQFEYGANLQDMFVIIYLFKRQQIRKVTVLGIAKLYKYGLFSVFNKYK